MSGRRIALAALLVACCLGSPAANAQVMYLTATGVVVRADVDDGGVEVLVDGLLFPEGIAVDVAGGMMYWTDPVAGKIQRASLQIPEGETPATRTDVEDLVTGSYAYGIALDVGNSEIYWTSSSPLRIQRANLDGSGVEDLVTSGLSFPWSIALDLAGGKMYLAGTQKIQRANLDGSNLEDLVTTTGSDSPFSVALDVANGKMYWIGAGIDFGTDPWIRRANLDGSGVESLVDLELGAKDGIALDADAAQVYWTVVGVGVLRANLDGSEVETVLDNAPAALSQITLDLTPPPVPTLSEWGILAMTVLLLAAGSVIIRRRGTRQNHCPQS